MFGYIINKSMNSHQGEIFQIKATASSPQGGPMPYKCLIGFEGLINIVTLERIALSGNTVAP